MDKVELLLSEAAVNIEVLERGDWFTDDDGRKVPMSITAEQTATRLLEVAELLRNEE